MAGSVSFQCWDAKMFCDCGERFINCCMSYSELQDLAGK
jgi:hypothetical protein